MWLLLAFIAIPLIEITLFIKVGGVIGLGWTLAIVLLTAIAGSWLVRMQGAVAMADLRSSLQELRDPREPIAHGAMIFFLPVRFSSHRAFSPIRLVSSFSSSRCARPFFAFCHAGSRWSGSNSAPPHVGNRTVPISSTATSPRSTHLRRRSETARRAGHGIEAAQASC